MRIVVANLPDDITEQAVREALSAFAPVDKIKLVTDSGAPSAVIEIDMTRAAADALAKRIQGRLYNGRPLRAWVPLHDW